MHRQFENKSEPGPQDTKDMDYQKFKTCLEDLNKQKKDFRKTDHKLERKVAQDVEKIFDDKMTDLRRDHTNLATQYDAEISAAGSKERWNILEISASALCCIPSYILTFWHCCNMGCNCCCVYPCKCEISKLTDEESDFSTSECGGNFLPLGPWGDRRRFNQFFPCLNFFSQPINTIRENLKDSEKQNNVLRDAVYFK